MKEINLQNTLPQVFVSEHIPASDVWNSEVTFSRGTICLVEAESGGGKSSMCSYIFGARRDYVGKILFDRRDVADISMDEWLKLRRTSLAYLPQEMSLFPQLSAWENVQLKNRLTSHFSDRKLADFFERLGIASRCDYPAGRLSIGQQQRVAIIRSICQPFDFLLLDEPVSHLDPNNNEIAAGIILEEAKKQGAGIIATSVGNKIALPYDKILKL